MRNLLAFAALFAVLTVALGSTPNSRTPQGTRYRWIYQENNVAAQTVIRFPRYTNTITADSDSIRSVNWVHIAQLNDNEKMDWIIYSSAFPDGADTVSTSGGVRSFTFGGCRIDSMTCEGGPVLFPDISVMATD
jgi:hypothetical protein